MERAVKSTVTVLVDTTDENTPLTEVQYEDDSDKGAVVEAKCIAVV